MGKIELPVETPLFCTYQWLASPGIVAKQNSTSDMWYVNYMIGLRCSKRFLHGYSSPELGPAGSNGIVWNFAFFQTSSLYTCFVRDCALTVVKAMLERGYYVAFWGVDDYYIKGKSFYGQRHFIHDGLISGYDDEDGTLTITSYDERWVFRTFKTPQEGFVQGLRAANIQDIEGALTAIKPTNEKQVLNIHHIHENTCKYLNSNLELYPPEREEDACGIVVYDYVCMYLEKLKDGSISHQKMDRRICRFLWEYIRCTHMRLLAVEKELGWDTSLSDSYTSIVKKANHLQFLYAKLHRKFSTSAIEVLQNGFFEIQVTERHILQAFVHRLEEVL